MRIFKFISLIIVGITISQFTSAQFSLSGEFRPRTEISHGYKTPASENQNTSTATTQRSRLNFMFNNEMVKTKLVLQDVRLWGGQPQLVNNEDFAVSIHEAWAEVFFAPSFSLQAGRQELSYDDQRIFGNVGWTQQARSHDLALFKYEKKVKIHIGIAHHENGNLRNNIYDGPDAYKDLQFIWFNKKSKNNSLSLLFLNNGKPLMGEEIQRTKYSQTIGGRFSQKIDFVTLSTNFYYQMGKNVKTIFSDTTVSNIVQDIGALNFLFEVSTKQGLTLGYEYLSGNPYNETSKIKSFTPFYGTNHKFNGFMDYFYVGNHIGSVGLNDIYLKYAYAKNKLGINSDLHYFAAAADISENAKPYLGTEIDLSASWAIQPAAKLSVGWSMMFASESMEILKGGDHTVGQNWAYIMLSVTPSFIK